MLHFSFPWSAHVKIWLNTTSATLFISLFVFVRILVKTDICGILAWFKPIRISASLLLPLNFWTDFDTKKRIIDNYNTRYLLLIFFVFFECAAFIHIENAFHLHFSQVAMRRKVVLKTCLIIFLLLVFSRSIPCLCLCL